MTANYDKQTPAYVSVPVRKHTDCCEIDLSKSGARLTSKLDGEAISVTAEPKTVASRLRSRRSKYRYDIVGLAG